MSLVASSQNFLAGLEFSFIPKKIPKAQGKLLSEKIKIFGGNVIDQINQATHVLFHRDITLEEGLTSVKLTTLPESALAVNADGLSACIAQQKLLPSSQFQVCLNKF